MLRINNTIITTQRGKKYVVDITRIIIIVTIFFSYII